MTVAQARLRRRLIRLIEMRAAFSPERRERYIGWIREIGWKSEAWLETEGPHFEVALLWALKDQRLTPTVGSA